MYYKHIHTNERVWPEDAPAYFLHKLFTDEEVNKDFIKDFPLYCFGDDEYTEEDVALQWHAVLSDKENREQFLTDYTDWYFSGNWIECDEKEDTYWIRVTR